MSVKVKICGITSPADGIAAADAGADMIGLMFCPQSPRHVSIEVAGQIAQAVPPFVVKVGVFVSASEELVAEAIASCGLSLLKFHGDESPEFCASFGNRAFKAYRGVPDASERTYIRNEAPALLVDAAVSGSYGGTGLTADWSAAARLAKHYPLLLAGGLNPDNVAEAVRQVIPWGVDVASGVESSPGKKDPGRMRSFVQAVRSALFTSPA